MVSPKLTALFALAAGIGVSGCTGYDDGYGYGGVNVGYGSGYYGSGYGNDYAYSNSGYGWYGDYYYPGNGYYVYDRQGRSSRWNGAQQRYFEGEGRRYALRDREDVRDARRFEREGRRDNRDFVRERRDDRQALRNGTVTREQFRTDRQADREAFRTDRREDRREFRRDLRDRPADGVRGGMRSDRGGAVDAGARQERRAARRAARGN